MDIRKTLQQEQHKSFFNILSIILTKVNEKDISQKTQHVRLIKMDLLNATTSSRTNAVILFSMEFDAIMKYHPDAVQSRSQIQTLSRAKRFYLGTKCYLTTHSIETVYF